MKKIILLVLVGLVVSLVIASLLSANNLGGVVIHNVTESFDAGIEVNGTERITSTGVFKPASLQIAGGTAITEYGCSTATWNPPSLGTSTVAGTATTTDIALTGAVAGDTCSASFSLATTSAASVLCHISGTATATIRLVNFDTAALDLATGTARVCYTAH